MYLLFDLITEPLSRDTGVPLIIVLAAIIAIEAVVLWLMKWQPFLVSAVHSVLMNLVTALLGYFATTAFLGLEGLLLAFALSVIIEAAVLMLLKRQQVKKACLVSLVANLASYAGIFVLAEFNGALHI